MSPVPIAITGSLCELCHQFIDNLFSFDFTRQAVYPARWLPVGSQWTPEKPWGDAFRHHETFGDLTNSAKMCELCNVLYVDLASLNKALHQGWLGLYPFWSSGHIGDNKLKGHFRAGFRDSLQNMPWGSNKIGSIPLHSFRICRREPLRKGEEVPWLDAYRRLPAVSTTLTPSHISRVAAKWRQECTEAHPNCVKSDLHNTLPTRVVDISDSETGRIRIYESKGEKMLYATLSHCWGGIIPSVTTMANLKIRTNGMDIDELPQNFKDAIEVTRAIGLRYLWIDALCIIQDSKLDWDQEAGRMYSVYAGASIVISVLDSAGSTNGFLTPNRAPLSLISDEYAVQKVYPDINECLTECPLNGRGWCMQERLLAKRVLHFGKEQMFWECLTDFKCEDGKNYTGESDGHFVAKFMKIRKQIGVCAAQGIELDWKAWYQLLEEYTTRKFTISTDKLPAVVGAAALFKSTKPTATYIAGLWREDIARGLLWCAHYYHAPGRKVWGISTTDEISELSKPPTKRAPSWSWAALDGALDFWALRIGGFAVEVLDVAIEAEKEAIYGYPDGIIKLRGRLAQMFYHPPQDNKHDVGVLTFEPTDSPNFHSGPINSCVMDLDRRSPRLCWALVMTESPNDKYLLVLHMRKDGSYRRVGMSTAHWREVDLSRFKTQEIHIT
ncbi:HET-domain-containing protein [Daldinia vernicosa]|uniref:HET-domain-containing protein n=1 Tax=Daldinia vernicosa TaxID=114800 RepID=UPI0020077995|nr:HET-domain-containing protein [Daldinia vernicosa]KAI0847267.1 HET-domain-containing protein [Daldinia vernicosa]